MLFNCSFDSFSSPLQNQRFWFADFTQDENRKRDEGSFFFVQFPWLDFLMWYWWIEHDENMHENRKFKLIERWDYKKKSSSYSLIDGDMKMFNFTVKRAPTKNSTPSIHIFLCECLMKTPAKAKQNERKIIMMKCN